MNQRYKELGLFLPLMEGIPPKDTECIPELFNVIIRNDVPACFYATMVTL